MNENFLGRNGFTWFNGVVEDRNDPLKTGRVKVRVVGVHTADKTVLPTTDLPWALCVLPITASGISGIGQSSTGLVEGSWVFGFFRDGESMQEPVVMGSLPGYAIELGNTSKGFYDPNFRLDAKGQPTTISVYPKNIDEPDTNRLAVNDPDKEATSLTNRKRNRITGIPIASFDGLENITEISVFDTLQAQEIGLIDPDYRGLERFTGGGGLPSDQQKLLNNDADAIEALLYGTGFTMEEDAFRSLLIRKYNITRDTDINALVTSIRNNIRGVIANTETDAEKWNQPEIAYNAVYPYNHVFESESGHIKEYDDTAGNERIHERHISGTSTEMTANGDRIDIIKNNHYTLTSNNNKAFIQGDSDITIGGRHKVYINKDGQTDNHYDIQVGPNANVNIQVDKGNLNVVTKTGQFNFDVGADFNVNVGGNYNLTVLGNKVESIEGNHTQDTTGTVVIKGSTIDLNP
jgi:hypothetical protein